MSSATEAKNQTPTSSTPSSQTSSPQRQTSTPQTPSTPTKVAPSPATVQATVNGSNNSTDVSANTNGAINTTINMSDLEIVVAKTEPMDVDGDSEEQPMEGVNESEPLPPVPEPVNDKNAVNNNPENEVHNTAPSINKTDTLEKEKVPDVNLNLGNNGISTEKLKAVVRPHILTHVIDNFVIQEANEPFPVSNQSLFPMGIRC